MTWPKDNGSRFDPHSYGGAVNMEVSGDLHPCVQVCCMRFLVERREELLLRFVATSKRMEWTCMQQSTSLQLTQPCCSVCHHTASFQRDPPACDGPRSYGAHSQLYALHVHPCPAASQHHLCCWVAAWRHLAAVAAGGGHALGVQSHIFNMCACGNGTTAGWPTSQQCMN